jgi:hypothetical protein
MMPDTRLGTSLLDSVEGLAKNVRNNARRLGADLSLDAEEELTRRSRLTGWRASGRVNAGGSCRLMPTADGQWLALNLARPDDIAALPALFESEVLTNEDVPPWESVQAYTREKKSRELLNRAVDLGLAIAILGETEDVNTDNLFSTSEFGDAPDLDDGTALHVVDLSSLWAGPLAGRILADLGCQVTKIESIDRPDGARFGPPEFFANLNSGKEVVELDLRTAMGRAELRRRIASADVVIEGSRPRALRQLGIERSDVLRNGQVRVWLSITAHGSDPLNEMRVGFGDDAAAAGGLVDLSDDGPRFIGDAIADPITGIVGADAILENLQLGRRVLVDVALARSAAFVAGESRRNSVS